MTALPSPALPGRPFSQPGSQVPSLFPVFPPLPPCRPCHVLTLPAPPVYPFLLYRPPSISSSLASPSPYALSSPSQPSLALTVPALPCPRRPCPSLPPSLPGSPRALWPRRSIANLSRASSLSGRPFLRRLPALSLF